jgi:microsomal dipeptidase-like Zn-dependent dipeptidase
VHVSRVILLLVIGADSMAAAAGTIVGSAALHEHVMAEHAFSGRWHWGSVDGDEASALGACDGNAGPKGPTHAGAPGACDPFGTLLMPNVLGRDTCCHSGGAGRGCSPRATYGFDAAGDADYRDWPIWDTKAHPRYWHGDLKRALDGGMKLMVVHAVENEFLCNFAQRYATAAQPGIEARAYPCDRADSSGSVTRQIAELKKFVGRHTFLEIAYSPAEARSIIGNGKMAIVIGVEADYAWGKEANTSALLTLLDRYYQMGARTIFLAHHLNTPLAGAAQFAPVLWAQQSVANCFDHDVQCGKSRKPFAVHQILPGRKDQPDAATYSEVTPRTMAARAAAPWIWDGYRAIGPGVEVVTERGVKTRKNLLGLTPQGALVVAEMMKLGMLIDVGHISERAIHDVADIAQAMNDYPIISSHTLVRSTLPDRPDKSLKEDATAGWEYALGDATLDVIARSGGVAGIFAAPDPTRDYLEPIDGKRRARVANNCVRSTRSLAQTMAYVVDRHVKVAWAGDWMGQGRSVAPRRGFTADNADWCGGNPVQQRAQGDQVPVLPLSSYSSDEARDSDYFATRGLGTWGLVRAFHQDLRDIGVRPDVLAEFADHGAENFVAAWEKSEAAAGFAPPRR